MRHLRQRYCRKDLQITAIEITLNILGAGGSLAGLLHMRHLLRAVGRDRLDNPALINRLHESAPYHRLAEVMSE